MAPSTESQLSRRHFLTGLLATLSLPRWLHAQFLEGEAIEPQYPLAEVCPAPCPTPCPPPCSTEIVSMEWSPVRDPDAVPVLYFHGTPSTYMEWRLLHQPLPEVPGGLFAFNRPGIGGSSFVPLNCLADWGSYFHASIAPALEARHRIQLRRFAIIAYSAGTPFAMACAAARPESVAAIAIIAGGLPGAPGVERGDLDRMRQIARRRPTLSTRAADQILPRIANPDGFRRSIQRSGMAPVDKAYACAHSRIQSDNLRDAIRCGTRGIVQDAGLTGYPWNLCLANISAPVDLWQGTCDRVLTMSACQYLADRLANSTLYRVEGAGHLTILPAAFPGATRALLARIHG